MIVRELFMCLSHNSRIELNGSDQCWVITPTFKGLKQKGLYRARLQTAEPVVCWVWQQKRWCSPLQVSLCSGLQVP